MKSETTAKPPVQTPAAPPQPSAQERAAIETSRKRLQTRTPRLSLTIKTDAKGKITDLKTPHADAMGWGIRLEDCFGTCGQAFAASEMNQLVAAARMPDGTLDNSRLNALLAVVDGAQPANEIEAMIAAQLAISHKLAIELLVRAARADMIPQMEAAGNLAAKLMRAFIGHAELLNKLKRGGEQVVRIEHVHVHAGGQAIVGNVATGANGTGGRGVEENGNQPHAPQILPPSEPRSLTAMASPALPSQDSEREPVPVASGQGAAALPDARRRAG